MSEIQQNPQQGNSLEASTSTPNDSTSYSKVHVTIADILLYLTAFIIPIFPVIVITGFSKDFFITLLLCIAGIPLFGVPGTVYAIIIIRRYRGPNAISKESTINQDGRYQRLNNTDVEAQPDRISLKSLDQEENSTLPPSYDETVSQKDSTNISADTKN